MLTQPVDALLIDIHIRMHQFVFVFILILHFKKMAPYIAPSRKGTFNLSAWLDPVFKSRLREIQMRHPEKTMQALYAEALVDLFKKYGVPDVPRTAVRGAMKRERPPPEP